MKKLLKDLAKSKLEGNALRHSVVTLKRYIKMAREESKESWWSVVLPLNPDHCEDVFRYLRSRSIPFVQIGIDSSKDGVETTRWGAFAFRYVSAMIDRYLNYSSGAITDEEDPVVTLEDMRRVFGFDSLFLRYFPPSVPEGLLYQQIQKDLQEEAK